MDRGAWGDTVHGVANSWTRLSSHKHLIPCILRWPKSSFGFFQKMVQKNPTELFWST